MAGHVRYTALLDACVLYSIATTDALVSLAVEGLFAAKWTTEIEREWIQAILRQRPDLNGKLDVRRDAMRDAVRDWEVPESAWRPLTANLELPDSNDVHVLAAAIAGHADSIVTTNLRDFPAKILQTHRIEAIDPDTFIGYQWDLDPVSCMTAFKFMRARWKRPNPTPDAFADAIERSGLPGTARRLRDAADLI